MIFKQLVGGGLIYLLAAMIDKSLFIEVGASIGREPSRVTPEDLMKIWCINCEAAD